MTPASERPAAKRQDYTAETIKEVLPKQIRVDEKGVYWRDFGEFLSLCPHSTPPEGTRTVAVFVPESDRSFLLQEVRRLENALEQIAGINYGSSIRTAGIARDALGMSGQSDA